MNTLLIVLIGQVGCLTLVIISLSLLGGLWLDRYFGTRPWLTLVLLLAGTPASVLAMLYFSRRTIARIKTRRDPMSAENLAVYKSMIDKSFVMKDLKKYKDMPTLLHTQSQNFFLTYPQLVSKAMQSFIRVDGTPKREKEKLTLKSFVAARSWLGLFWDAFSLARAWR